MHEDPVVTPDKFRGVLCDDVKRRHFILDADVKEHTMALASIDAVRNQEGKIVSEVWGGKRRIDRILINHESSACITGFAFSTALAGLTDHIPVSLSLKVNNPLPQPLPLRQRD